MTTLTIADEVAARLEAKAASRGLSIEDWLAEVAGVDDETVDDADDRLFLAFVGSGASGDTRNVDIHVLRHELAERRAAEGIENL